jgi:hypothetical protein
MDWLEEIASCWLTLVTLWGMVMVTLLILWFTAGLLGIIS